MCVCACKYACAFVPPCVHGEWIYDFGNFREKAKAIACAQMTRSNLMFRDWSQAMRFQKPFDNRCA